MDILQLIDRLEELFNESKAIPLTHNVMVDEDKMLELIDQMRIAIPDEVKKAQQVLAQRDRVMAHKDNIAIEAQRRAEQILSQARADAEATRVDADNYVIDSLSKIEHELDRLVNEVRNGIRLVEEEQLRKAGSPLQESSDK